MEQGQLNWIANFIWGIPDGVLRDLYVRGRYRDVIPPMTVLRRLDAVLEPAKRAVLEMGGEWPDCAATDKPSTTGRPAALGASRCAASGNRPTTVLSRPGAARRAGGGRDTHH
jgi:type I restriction enzyme M protein